MNKKNKYLSLLIFIAIIGLVMCGFVTRRSNNNDVDVTKLLKNSGLNLFISKYESDITQVFTEIEQINSIDDLIDSSPIIIRAKLSDNFKRTKYYYTTLTEIDVIEVYKGSVENNNISIFEPIDVIEKYKEVDSLEGYNFLSEDKEYILFLRPLKDSNYSNEKFVYLPTTTVLSKYAIDDTKAVKIENEVEYGDVKSSEVFLNDEYNVNKFNEIKSQILKKY